MGSEFSSTHFIPTITSLATDPGFRVRKVSRLLMAVL